MQMHVLDSCPAHKTVDIFMNHLYQRYHIADIKDKKIKLIILKKKPIILFSIYLTLIVKEMVFKLIIKIAKKFELK